MKRTFICRVPETVCLQPNEKVDVDVSESNQEFQVNHRREMERWFDPGIMKSDHSGKISLRNNTLQMCVLIMGEQS